ncbi:BMP-binding endothelial regulator protein-like isoform X1 [Stylophora pistillata]|uniref:BMP-binding endothelial regulator protein n=1 Tax=Stylophora pistillata TaxID=50429 RepID=A0A2B4S078_STYPI|nr:BMP-binding endothelial regulator protein-like isoform X1 [Stylophora pistillata]PFX24104.1 BMP-binding endothelial regulator protein [Stylophora pistillata]
MLDSTQGNLRLSSSLAFLLLISSAAGSGVAPGFKIQGSLASCTVENAVIDLPILAGNPCFVCRCKNKSVECSREICPRTNTCKGTLKREKGKCCPVCNENQGPASCTHQGRSYKHNDSWFAKDCQICFCTNGTVSCQLQKCSPPNSLRCPEGKTPGQVPGACCPQCIEKTGVCTSYGDPHYQTFDGQMFNFHGTCRYQLTSDNANFTIRMRNERRYSNVYAWSKALSIHLGDSSIVLHRDLQVKVNKSDVKLPYYHLPYFQITKGGFTITLVSNIGVQVQWDGNGFIEIQLPKSLMGKVNGLCGNFNGFSTDDFNLKNGRRAVSAQEFGESWSLGRRNHGCEKAPSEPVKSTVSQCYSHLRGFRRAHKRCLPMKKQFANCHTKVKPNAYFWSCVAAVCQCTGRRCECDSVLAYARACRREGVTVNWGRKNSCGVSCKGGAVFDDCAPVCQRTCDNKDDVSVPCPSSSCVPGCRCPAGTVWNNQRTKCIAKRKCPSQLASIQGKLRRAAVSSKRSHKWIRQLKDNDRR